MDTAKSLLAMPYVSHLLKWEYWPYYLAAVVVLVLLILLVLLRTHRIKRLIPEKFAIRRHLPGGGADRQEQMAPSSLRKAWQRFLAQIPRQFRWAIQSYQPFIVFGEAGSGKSLLIDNYTDWRGQANRFYPSYTVDPLLQIYLGSRALVTEIPAPLLYNTSPQARSALLKLWKPLFSHREATVAAVLNVTALLQEPPGNLRGFAQMLRGKLNILSSVQKRPVRVSIALTHMDQVEGYAEFSEFLRAERIPLDIRFLSEADENLLTGCLEPYEALLSRALTRMSSDEYLKTIRFFRTTPEILTALSSFVRALQAPDPLTSPPRVARLCLVSRDGKDAPDSNPFLLDLPEEETAGPVPNLRHRIAATAVLAAGMLYLGASYYLERNLMLKMDEKLNRIDLSPLEQYSDYSHGLFIEVSRETRESLVRALPPNFFLHAEEHVRDHFVAGIRKYYLLPCFLKLGKGEDAHEKGIYLVGLYLATKTNDLGRLVLANVEEWRKALNMPSSLITDYVTNSTHADVTGVDFRNLPLTYHKGVGPLEDPLPWLIFFRKIQKAIDEPSISKEYLHELQKEATAFLGIVERVSRFRLTGEIVSLLKHYPAVEPHVDWIQRRDVILEQQSLRDFLVKITQGDIEYPPAAGLGLAQFMEAVKLMTKLGQPDRDRDKSYDIRMYEQVSFQFSGPSWNSLLIRSRITLFMREYLARNRRTDGLLFFDKSGSIGFPDLVMNPSNDGQLFFEGKGKVDGRFSKSAFEQLVKPVLTELPEVLQSLPVVDEEKKRFSNFILKQAEAYADRYVAAYRSYYSQFRLAADSLGGLRYLLKQIQLPTSPFQDFLASIKENTVLDVGESPFLRQFAKKLGTFEFIRRLMAEKDGAVPEWDKYKAILKQMDDEIDGTEPFTVKNKADDANELKRILSPVGRICLGIQRGENDSYAGLIKGWIKSVGMGNEWQPPFLDPAMIAFFLGRSDVEIAVEKVWSDLEDSYIKPLHSKFPFNLKAEVEISPPELEKIVHPQGAFWKSFRDYLAPICRETSGYWTERVSPQGTFRIPVGMLDTVNEMSRLASALWSDKGVAQPISVEIRPTGLPPRIEHAPVAVLSYLRSDKSSVFAFNQQPAWQKLEIEWWKAQTSAVGVEFEAHRDSGKSYREITIAEKFWSFHHLLRRAEMMDKSVFSWRITGPGPHQQPVKLEFAFKTDPWAAFRLNP